MTTNFHLDYAPMEDNRAVKGAQILNALFEGGQAAFQGVQKRRLYDELQRESNENTPLAAVSQGHAKNEGPPGVENAETPNVQWTRQDLVPGAESHFKRAKLLALNGDTEGAKIERAAGEKASIDNREARKYNLKTLSENKTTIRNLQDTDRIFNQLSQVNNSLEKRYKPGSKFWTRLGDNLKLSPDGASLSQLGKVFSSKEDQIFIKNLAQLIKGAKDSFGARVTNFELGAYMNQFPNLWQDPEARKSLIESLQVVNDLNLKHARLVQQGLAQTGLNANPATFDLKIDEAMAPYIEAANQKISKITDTALYGNQEAPKELEGFEDVQFRNGAWYGKKGDQWYKAE